MGNHGNAFLSFGNAFNLTGLKAYFHMDEASGNIINTAISPAYPDGLGTDADGTASGAPTYAQTGVIDDAISFDGSGDWFALGSSLSQFNFMHNTDDLTISFWMKLNATETNDNHGIIGTENFNPAANIGCGIYMDDRSGVGRDHQMGILISNGTAGIELRSADNFIPKNTTTWYHYILTKTISGGDVIFNMYRDNANNQTNTTAYTPSSSNASYSNKIGTSGNDAIGSINAQFDEISIWNRILTSDERAELYNGGLGRLI